MSGDNHTRQDLRSYGRRRGRAPSRRQAELWRDVLPRVAVDLAQPAPASLTDLFAPPVEDVWLEIGFGGGEHLVWQARANPGVGLIGCEPFQDGVVKVLSAIGDSRRSMFCNPPLPTPGGREADALANIRVLADDARPLLRWLPSASIGRAFVLFPDPWPKARHRKRRLVSEATLGEIARVLRPGAELRLATDDGDYAGAMLLAIGRQAYFQWTANGPDDWRRRPADWPATRYEEKALREGRRCYFLSFHRG
ncbi:MAG: tRNA (guanosine(46)-N(7))-methyltransferase TrmB [Hyphomicrobiaceae bacterium]